MIENLDDRKIELKKLFQGLNKGFTDSVSLPGTEEKEIERFTTGCETLNRVLGGGWPRGRIIEMYGPPSAGKTSLAILAGAEIQKSGGLVAYIDTDHALDSVWCSLLGLKLKDTIFSQPDSGEQAIDIIADIVESSKVELIIVDSVASLSPIVEIQASTESNQMGLQARMLSKALRRLTVPANKAKCTILFLNQLRANLGSYGSPEVTPGGSGLKFAASIRLEVRRIKELFNEKDLVIGHTIKVKTVKNKTAPPFAVDEFNFFCGNGEDKLMGVDYIGDLVDTARKLEIINQGGAWFMYGTDKFQGKVKTVDWFRESPARIEELRQKVNSNVKLTFEFPDVVTEY